MSDSNLTVGSITSSYYPDDKHGFLSGKITQESQLESKDDDFDYGWIYYVVIGHLEDSKTWQQDYIVPFKDEKKAEEYRDDYLNNSYYCQVFIVKQNLFRPPYFS